MLIIEGSDCLGKTTAAKRIVQLVADRVKQEQYEYPIRYSHMTRPNDAFDFFTHYRDMISLYAVQDRFHLGALVWHDNVMCEAQLRTIEGWLQSLGSITVVFAAPDDDWYKYHLGETEHMFSVEALMDANREYRSMIERSFIPKPHIDFHVLIGEDCWPTDEELMDIVDSWMRRIRYAEC